MLATQIRQKDSFFYFISYPVQDLLAQVRFNSRFYGDPGEKIEAEPLPEADEVAGFIAKIEKTDSAFQRELSRAKVKSIINFYETATTQPPIPGAVLLFTKDKLDFEPLGDLASAGHLSEPREKFLIIDGQHRLAALHFYARKHPEEAATLRIPCMIFDGHHDDFAAEMFVTINSTASRINKSHLVDLYEKVTWAAPDRKFAARVAEKLYSESDSPLRYRINRLGGRSRQEKWILQAELFNEIHRWTQHGEWNYEEPRAAEHAYALLRDFLAAARSAWGEAWGQSHSMVAKPVTLKAMLRLCAELARQDSVAGETSSERLARWRQRLAPWGQLGREFRAEGFYERFPAKGQVERVGRVQKRLAEAAGIVARPRARRARPGGDE